ncbi:MAG: DUF2236 domain-containing protein [Verrucomicrobia bacterium]|nr:DUF2236 domain-containing protein [Verrucomicrobiota bacterium]
MAGGPSINYLEPAGDPGVFGPDSVTWRVLSNPATVFMGGVAAVLFELAEPRVRSGVWDHTDFRRDPARRVQRTGLATMVFTYGPTRDVEALTSRVRRLHERVRGTTPEGQPYDANDPELLTWVYVTAGYGFLNAYLRYANPRLSRAEQDRYYAESMHACRYYGIKRIPASVREVEGYLEAMRPRLRHHEIVDEFLRLVSDVPLAAAPALPVQRLLVQAAVGLLPPWARGLLKLNRGQRWRHAAGPLIHTIAALSGRLVHNGAPQQACRRMGRPASLLAR